MSTTIIAGNATNNGASISSDTAGTLQIQTGSTPTTAITVDASQSVGIGATPSTWSLLTPVQVKNAAYSGYLNRAYITANLSFNGSDWKYIASDYANAYMLQSGEHQWYRAASGTAGATATLTQAMTLDASGNLLVGTTSFTVGASSGTVVVGYNGATQNGFKSYDSNTSAGTDTAVVFIRGTTNVGQITTTLSATAYGTSSDYRLKENVVPMQNALATVSQLKPVTYDWIATKEKGQGFIAHELAEVCPESVVGEKDAVDEEGNPKYQAIDTSFLVATLTAAIQEQQTMIEELKTKVAALEAK